METEAIRRAWTLALCQFHRGDPSALDALDLAGPAVRSTADVR
jgi:hypothetical protein